MFEQEAEVEWPASLGVSRVDWSIQAILISSSSPTPGAVGG